MSLSVETGHDRPLFCANGHPEVSAHVEVACHDEGPSNVFRHPVVDVIRHAGQVGLAVDVNDVIAFAERCAVVALVGPVALLAANRAYAVHIDVWL